MLLNEIVGHRKHFDSLSNEDATYFKINGFPRQRHTTKGWSILVQWKDCSSDWLILKDQKDHTLFSSQNMPYRLAYTRNLHSHGGSHTL